MNKETLLIALDKCKIEILGLAERVIRDPEKAIEYEKLIDKRLRLANKIYVLIKEDKKEMVEAFKKENKYLIEEYIMRKAILDLWLINLDLYDNIIK